MSAARKPAGAKVARVSEHDREHFRKIGRFQQEGHDEALRRHLSRSGTARLLYSFQMMLDGAYFTPRFPLVDQDNPGLLYERARRLGLYRP